MRNMPSPLLMAINWMALLQVACVTIVATVIIAALMSLSNWCFTPAEGSDHPTAVRKTFGFVVLGIMCLLVLFGLYLMIPYFHTK